MIAEVGEYGALVRSLAERRRALGLSQVELDEKIGATEGQVAKWESGARRPSPFLLLCWVSSLGLCLGVFLAPAGELAAANSNVAPSSGPSPLALTGTASRARRKAPDISSSRPSLKRA